MSLLVKANKLFVEKKYNEAYELYVKAEKIYGRAIIKYQIEKCESFIELEDKEEENGNYTSNDVVTNILQDNSKTIVLSNTERSRYLNEYKQIKSKKSVEADVKKVNPIPSDWPEDLTLSPLPKGTNDYRWYEKYNYKRSIENHVVGNIGLSVIVPTFN